MVGAALGLPGSPGPGAGCRLAACEPSVGCAPAPQTRAAVWAEAEQPKPASPGSKARAPAGAPGTSLPGCGRGAPPHARCPSLSVCVLASSSPKDSSPSDRDHPHDPIRPEPPIEDSYFQIRSHSEVWGVRTPTWGHSSAPKTRGSVEQGTVMPLCSTPDKPEASRELPAAPRGRRAGPGGGRR